MGTKVDGAVDTFRAAAPAAGLTPVVLNIARTPALPPV